MDGATVGDGRKTIEAFFGPAPRSTVGGSSLAGIKWQIPRWTSGSPIAQQGRVGGRQVSDRSLGQQRGLPRAGQGSFERDQRDFISRFSQGRSGQGQVQGGRQPAGGRFPVGTSQGTGRVVSGSGQRFSGSQIRHPISAGGFIPGRIVSSGGTPMTRFGRGRIVGGPVRIQGGFRPSGFRPSGFGIPIRRSGGFRTVGGGGFVGCRT